MLSIDKRSSFSLKPPEFSCCQPIHKEIVPLLPCSPFFMTITGSAGSGKTSMLVNLLTSPQAYKKVTPRGALYYPGTFRRISEKEHVCQTSAYS